MMKFNMKKTGLAVLAVVAMTCGVAVAADRGGYFCPDCGAAVPQMKMQHQYLNDHGSYGRGMMGHMNGGQMKMPFGEGMQQGRGMHHRFTPNFGGQRNFNGRRNDDRGEMRPMYGERMGSQFGQRMQGRAMGPQAAPKRREAKRSAARMSFKDLKDAPENIRTKFVELEKLRVDMRDVMSRAPLDKAKAMDVYGKMASLRQELNKWRFERRLDELAQRQREAKLNREVPSGAPSSADAKLAPAKN